jgi:hypothetical protein
MINVQILTQYTHCHSEAHLPIGESQSYTGEAYIRHIPCPA